MSFAPKGGPIVAEFLSGFTALLLGYFALSQHLDQPLLHASAGIAIAASTLMAWLIGSFVDALRNFLVEGLLDRYWFAINWEFFVKGKQEEVANIEQYFFSFYMIDMDIAIAVVLFLGFGPCILSIITERPIPHFSLGQTILFSIGALIFFLDALSLRREMRKYVN